ncbi:HlyD family secretion protein [Amaricoccus tamworthensis]|uniref:HlyD family secretion protein n=1 Tax=Amaricoccus tamworthensis TaxID=57002 RepID=UPI003C7A1619
MFELMFTSFPVIIRYFQLRRRGEAMTVWNMKTAVYLWLLLAFFLFLTIFYFHQKSYSGIVPFRTVSVVAQTSGPVTEINVINGQRVETGDVLFRIEDSSQRAALAQAEAQFDQITADEDKARETLRVSQAEEAAAQIELENLRVDLSEARTLLERQVGREDDVRNLQAQVSEAEAHVAAMRAQVDLSETELTQTIPARRKAAETAVESAQVALDHTVVRSFTDGVVTQLVLGEGSPATTLILSPAMVIIPDRPADTPIRIVAGFSQIARSTLYEGMPAEIACNSNADINFRDSVLPAKVVGIQPAVASGQVIPGARLVDPDSLAERGSLVVYFELEYPEHEAMMLDGTGCIVQTYTNNIPGIGGHVVAATGIIKAVGLRIKVWGMLLSGIGLAGGGH